MSPLKYSVVSETRANQKNSLEFMAWQTLVAGGAAALPRLLYTVKTVVKQAYSGLNLSHRGFK